MVHLVLQLLVQTNFLSCPSYFTVSPQEKTSNLSFHGKTILCTNRASQALPCRAELKDSSPAQQEHYYTVKPDVNQTAA